LEVRALAGSAVKAHEASSKALTTRLDQPLKNGIRRWRVNVAASQMNNGTSTMVVAMNAFFAPSYIEHGMSASRQA